MLCMYDWNCSIWLRCYVTNGLPLTSSMSVEYSGYWKSIGRQLLPLVSQCVSTILHTLKTPWNESVVVKSCCSCLKVGLGFICCFFFHILRCLTPVTSELLTCGLYISFTVCTICWFIGWSLAAFLTAVYCTGWPQTWKTWNTQGFL